jgi:group I intron endonuclease
MKIGSVYKITCLINNKCYIGITIQNPPQKRWIQHLHYDRAHYRDKLLFRAFDKHGKQNFIFDVICQTKNIDYLKELEVYFIEKYKSYVNRISPDGFSGYNMTLGGDGVFGLKFSPEAKDRCSKAQTLRHEKNPELFQNLIKKWQKAGRNKKTNEKRSLSLKKYFQKGHKTWSYGHNLSKKHRNKTSQTMKMNKIKPSDLAHQKSAEVCAKNWEVISPSGEKFIIKNLRKFCLERNLSPQNLWKVSKNLISHSQGWKCKLLASEKKEPT